MTFQTIKYHEAAFLIRVLRNVSVRWPRHGHDSSGHSSSDRRDAQILALDLEGGTKTILDDRDREVVRDAFRQARNNPTYYLEASDVCSETITSIDRHLAHILRTVEQAAPVAVEREPYSPTASERRRAATDGFMPPFLAAQQT